MAYTIDEREAPIKELRNGRGESLRLINEATGSKYLDFHVNVLRVGSGPGPYHYHSNAENIYYVLEGVAQVNIEGRLLTAGPGVAVWIPANERHDVENIGDVDLRVIEIKVPADSDFIMADRPDPAVTER